MINRSANILLAKKGLISFLVVLFLLTSTGFTLSTHFQGSSYYSFSVTDKAESCCASDCDCCSEQNLTVKINDDYEFSIPVTIKIITIVTELPYIDNSIRFFNKKLNKFTNLIRPPPLLDQTNPSYLQIFRC